MIGVTMNRKEAKQWLIDEAKRCRNFPEPHKRYIILALLEARWCKPEHVFNCFAASLETISMEARNYWIRDAIKNCRSDMIHRYQLYQNLVKEEMSKQAK